MYSITWLPQSHGKRPRSSHAAGLYCCQSQGRPKEAPTSFVILDGLFLKVLKYVWAEFLLQPIAVVSEKALQTVPGTEQHVVLRHCMEHPSREALEAGALLCTSSRRGLRATPVLLWSKAEMLPLLCCERFKRLNPSYSLTPLPGKATLPLFSYLYPSFPSSTASCLNSSYIFLLK